MVKSILEYYKFELTRRFCNNEHSLITMRVTKKLENLISSLPSNNGRNYVLDFGCGEGYALPGLASKYREVVGIDIDPNSIRSAKESSKSKSNVSFVLADAQNLPFREEIFDLIIANHVLEHIMQVEKAIENIYRVLRKNGYVSVEVPWISELLSISFGLKFPLQLMRTMIHRALDDVYYRKSSLLVRLLFKTSRGKKVRIRKYIPLSYYARTLKKSIDLQEYAELHLKRELNDPHHKHWFSRKEWIIIVNAYGLKIRNHRGIFNVKLVAQK